MKSKYIAWSAFGLVVFLAIFLLQGNKARKEWYKNGGFSRTYLNSSFHLLETKQLSYSYLQQSGLVKDKQYLYAEQAKELFQLLLIGDNLNASKVVLPGSVRVQNGHYQFTQNTLYVFNNKDFQLRKYNIEDNFSKLTELALDGYVLQPKVLTDGSILYKSFIGKTANFRIHLIDTNGKKYVNENLFKGGIDLANDGFIQRYKDGFVYACMYRNTVKILDRYLNIKGSYTTIDTANASPGVVRLANGGITFKRQPAYVKSWDGNKG